MPRFSTWGSGGGAEPFSEMMKGRCGLFLNLGTYWVIGMWGSHLGCWETASWKMCVWRHGWACREPPRQCCLDWRLRSRHEAS